jgi:hypothetical protein
MLLLPKVKYSYWYEQENDAGDTSGTGCVHSRSSSQSKYVQGDCAIAFFIVSWTLAYRFDLKYRTLCAFLPVVKSPTVNWTVTSSTIIEFRGRNDDEKV